MMDLVKRKKQLRYPSKLNPDRLLWPYMSWANTGVEEYNRVMAAIQHDYGDLFVMLIHSPKLHDLPPPYKVSDFGKSIIINGAVNCADAVIAGEVDEMIDPHFGFTPNGWTALHEASIDLRLDLLKKLVHSGFVSPDVRADNGRLSLKRALPLNVGLETFRLINSNSRPPVASAVCLLIKVYSKLGKHLKAIRFLALNTRDFKQEFFNYVRNGKWVEVGTLLLAAGEKLLPLSVRKGKDKLVFNSFKEISDFLQANHRLYRALRNGYIWEWMDTIRLFDIYDKYANQLTAYVELDEDRRSGMEVATLLDADEEYMFGMTLETPIYFDEDVGDDSDDDSDEDSDVKCGMEVATPLEADEGFDGKIGGNNFHDFVNRLSNSSFDPLINLHGERDKLVREQNMFSSWWWINQRLQPASNSDLRLSYHNLCSKKAPMARPVKSVNAMPNFYDTKRSFSLLRILFSKARSM